MISLLFSIMAVLMASSHSKRHFQSTLMGVYEYTNGSFKEDQDVWKIFHTSVMNFDLMAPQYLERVNLVFKSQTCKNLLKAKLYVTNDRKKYHTVEMKDCHPREGKNIEIDFWNIGFVRYVRITFDTKTYGEKIEFDDYWFYTGTEKFDFEREDLFAKQLTPIRKKKTHAGYQLSHPKEVRKIVFEARKESESESAEIDCAVKNKETKSYNGLEFLEKNIGDVTRFVAVLPPHYKIDRIICVDDRGITPPKTAIMLEDEYKYWGKSVGGYVEFPNNKEKRIIRLKFKHSTKETKLEFPVTYYDKFGSPKNVWVVAKGTTIDLYLKAKKLYISEKRFQDYEALILACDGINCNRGSCRSDSSSERKYSCVCHFGFDGDHCEKRKGICYQAKEPVTSMNGFELTKKVYRNSERLIYKCKGKPGKLNFICNEGNFINPYTKAIAMFDRICE